MAVAAELAIETRLMMAGLRPTRQRVALADLLFAKGDRHLTVEELHEEAVSANVPVSLATIYNTLHQFTEAGMIRVLAVESAKTYFDTNVSDHHHFFVKGHNEMLDIVKSRTEIDYMRKAARIVETIHARIVEKAKVGLRKIYDAGIRGTPEFGGDYPAIVPLLPSAANASAPHLTWDDRPMKRGERTFFEIAGCYNRYHCALSRTRINL